MTYPEPNGAQIGLMLIDENQVFAEALAMRLREEPGVTAVPMAGSVSEAATILPRFHPDVLLVDYGVRGDMVLQLMAELSELETTPAVLVLSAVRDPHALVTSLELGVRGWVNKDSTFATLWAAVQDVRAGHMVLSPSAVEPVVLMLLEVLRAQQPTAERPDFVADLSPRQYEVLRCLVAGLNKRQIAERLYLSVNTVRTHVRHLLREADEHTTLALVAAARELHVTGIDNRH